MTTSADIRNIQAGLSARRPNWKPAVAAITTPNTKPTGTSAGNDVLVSSGDSAVYTTLAVVKGGNVTSFAIRWWGYYAGLAEWCLIPGSTAEDLTENWTQLIPSGPFDRVYCQVTAVNGSDGVVPRVGVCEGSSI